MPDAYFLRRPKFSSTSQGFPDYTINGLSEHILDDGTTSGVWQIAISPKSGLLGGWGSSSTILTGSITFNKPTGSITVRAQGGGGGGGAGNYAYYGSDGADGAWADVSASFQKGEYAITLGRGGDAPYDAAGVAGTETTIEGVPTVFSGGAGGAYKGGNRNQSHHSILSNYGKGGVGGSTTHSSGSVSTTYISTGGYAYDRPNDVSGNNMGWYDSGTTIYVDGMYEHEQTSGRYFYKMTNGYYIASENVTTQSNDTRKWRGAAGQHGAIILAGRV